MRHRPGFFFLEYYLYLPTYLYSYVVLITPTAHDHGWRGRGGGDGMTQNIYVCTMYVGPTLLCMYVGKSVVFAHASRATCRTARDGTCT
ncbi:hypothetical protein F4775DRAFT_28973 [Biscogniauxia sp. FL1348]|nr:hypothetical protein F4775DRAFT_28973 [Biscogniauxia sp. FL1348]